MANFCGVGRTNYFAVKDKDAFKEALASLSGVEVIENEEDGKFCLLDDDLDGSGWYVMNNDDESDEQVDLADFIAPFLADGHVAIVEEAGFEKHRYISGWAVAINNKKERREIHLNNDIVELAKQLGSEVTEALY